MLRRKSHVLFTHRGHVAGTCNGECSRDKITTCTHVKNEAEKCESEVLQGRIHRVNWHINENEFRLKKNTGQQL